MSQSGVSNKMTPKKLEKLLKLAKQYDCKTLKIDGIEIEFKPTYHEMPVGIPADDKLKEPTEDEMLFWSAPDIDRTRERIQKN